ncbi:hypothetical protein WJ970_23940 [Achromobacter xylosoxidans]
MVAQPGRRRECAMPAEQWLPPEADGKRGSTDGEDGEEAAIASAR